MLHVAILYSGLLAVMLADSPTPEDLRAYQAAAANAGRDADAHVRLASWCELHGLNAQRHEHLATALEIDPDHAAAHGLVGEVAANGAWRMPGTVVAEHRGDVAAAATLALYHARRDKIPDTAQAHWQLAEWCDQNGLKAEATTHLTSVVRLNPSHEEALRKLGYKKQKARWTSAELTAAIRSEAEAQRRADAKWRPLLQKWKGWLDRKARRAEAEAGLAGVRDPRAVPSIWKVFSAGGADDQEQAVRLLRQIDAPTASRALASLATTGASDEVRQSAAASLLRRDPREFASSLIGLLRDPIKYDVRRVEGPGKPGELYVEGERANSRYFYAAPPPMTTLRPTDILSFDYNGLPVATRVVGSTREPLAAVLDSRYQGAPDLTGAPEALAKAGLGQAGMQLGERMIENQQQSAQIGLEMATPRARGVDLLSRMPANVRNDPASAKVRAMMQGSGRMVPVPLTAQVPVGQFVVQAQQQAALSRARLQEDVAALDRYNKDVNQTNERAAAALQTALRKESGPERKAWVKWWNELVGTATGVTPLPDNRSPGHSPATPEPRAMLPAFGAETTLLALSGSQPIEAIRAGDLVLTQDTSTGALAFTPVLMIHHADPQLVKTISVGGSPIVATDLERFWVAGKGWVMVLDLKAGDVIRALGHVVRVDTVEDAGARPVYHVQVAAGRGIVVAESGILAHDERAAVPSAGVFDAASVDTITPRGH